MVEYVFLVVVVILGIFYRYKMLIVINYNLMILIVYYDEVWLIIVVFLVNILDIYIYKYI